MFRLAPTPRGPLPRGALSVLLLLSASVAGAQTTAPVQERTEFTDVPEVVSDQWTRIGEGPAFVLPDDGLVINDNSVAARIAYQGYLGAIEAHHRVVVRARVKLYSNLGGDAAVLEVARPGLEVRLRLYPDRIDVVERGERREPRWLASVVVDLGDFREITLVKTAADASSREIVRVEVDGVEVARCHPRGEGSLDVGRVLFGSLSYFGLGASVWQWIEVELEAVGADGSSVATEDSNFGSFKGRWSPVR